MKKIIISVIFIFGCVALVSAQYVVSYNNTKTNTEEVKACCSKGKAEKACCSKGSTTTVTSGKTCSSAEVKSCCSKGKSPKGCCSKGTTASASCLKTSSSAEVKSCCKNGSKSAIKE